MVVLSAEEKREMCITLAQHLPKLRELLSLSQYEFARRCGISPPRLSVIENGHHIMSWMQFCAILFVCTVNRRTKEYFYANSFLSVRLLQFLQQKDENIMPDTNITVGQEALYRYQNRANSPITTQEPDHNTIYTPSVQFERINILDNTSRDILFEYSPDKDLFMYSYIAPNGTLVRKELANYFTSELHHITVHPAYAELYRASLLKAAQTPSDASFEYMTRMALSDYAWHRLSYRSIAEPNGAIKKVYGRAENIDCIVRERNLALERASTDLLTGIYNKTSFLEKMKQKLNDFIYSSHAVIMIDLDNFKMINDQYGHVIGDSYLQEIAKTLLRVFPAGDLIGRFGGDEFIVYLENITVDVLRTRIDRFQTEVADILDCRSIITCSIGAYWSRTLCNDEAYLIDKADKAMYRIKKEQKNGYCIDTDPQA